MKRPTKVGICNGCKQEGMKLWFIPPDSWLCEYCFDLWKESL